MRRFALSLALFGCLAVPVLAQQNPNKDLGFNVEKAYHVGDVDSVNAFNGNLVVTIPIGQRYPVGGSLSYGLSLVYNSNLWEEKLNGASQSFAEVNPTFNAGLGWKVSLGELLAPQSGSNHSPWYVYVSPDGAHHPFGGTSPQVPFVSLHRGEQAQTDRSFSRDGTYLRFTEPGKIVEFPNGDRHFFESSCANGVCRLIEMRDRFNNSVLVTYTGTTWTLKDNSVPSGTARTHTVTFERQAIPNTTPVQYTQPVVRYVDLRTHGGGTSRWTFRYAVKRIERACPNDASMAEPWQPFLVGVEQPDAASWAMPIPEAPTQQDPAAYNLPSGPSTCQDDSGVLLRLQTPTSGWLVWTYGTYSFPSWGSARCREFQYHTVGVATRTVLSALPGTWTYTSQTESNECGTTPPIAHSRYLLNTVTNPLGQKTEQWFSVARRNNTGFEPAEYGLPLTRTEQQDGRWLSKKIYEANGALKRSEYVSYTFETPYDLQVPGEEYPIGTDFYHKRVNGTRTVFNDIGVNSYKDVALSSFDGLGHYRTATITGGSAWQSRPTRLETTNYNPQRGTYPGSFVPILANQAWQLETYDSKTVAEGGLTERADYRFHATTGFLECERRRRNAGTLDGRDVVTLFTADAKGNVSQERWYGGDRGGAGTGSDPCGVTAAPEYTFTHTYTAGVRATTQPSGVVWRTLDRTIDTSSGLPSSSWDSAGTSTSYNWDSLGRLTLINPTGRGETHYTYSRAQGSSSAKVTIEERDAGGTTRLARSILGFDGFGRLQDESNLLPELPWTPPQHRPADRYASRRTQYNGAGWVLRVSEMQGPGESGGDDTRYQNHDPFGRPTRIRPSDAPGNNSAHDINLSYAGTEKLFRTVRIGTTAGATPGAVVEEAVTTTEIYDLHGRLFRVVEPAAPGGADLETRYSYDAGGRLRKVEQVHPPVPPSVASTTQERTFLYDGRGFLFFEQHPEKGAASFQYDSRGNLIEKADGTIVTKYTYNGTGDLRTVRQGASGELLLKDLTYGTTGSAKGKLVLAERRQYPVLPDGTTTLPTAIRETYTYGDAAGRVTKKETDFRLDPAVEGALFEQSFAYTDLDDVAQLGYPKCQASFLACDNDPAESAPTVTYIYDAGALQAVPGYASSLGYHGNGMVKSVAHTNGVTETIGNDPHQQARPGSISASGPFASWTTGTFTWDGVGNIKTMGGSWFLYDKVSRLKEAHVKTGTSGTGAEVFQVYNYDGFGNLTGYTGTVGRNLPTALATNRLNAATFDDRGNMTAWSGNVYTWTGTDQLERHQIPSNTTPDTGENWYHLYTADEERLVSVDWKGEAKYLRFRDLDGRILREMKQTISGGNELWTVERDYIYRGNQLLVAETPQGRRHFHPDHLGTPRLITNAAGQQVAFHTYYPFGEEATVWNQDTERLKFTGHERDFLSPNGAGDDLDAMRARYCSPITGRFLGVDPARGSGSVKRPGSWNRYSYSLNNPLNLVDPDGEVPLLLYVAAGVVGGLLFGPDAANTPTSPDDPGIQSSNGMNGVVAAAGSIGIIALVKQFFTAGSRSDDVVEDESGGEQAADMGGGASEKTSSTTTTRPTPGRDGATSTITLEKDVSGKTTSRTHTVTKDGEVIHQHQEHMGRHGSERRFPDEWTGTRTTNAPQHTPKRPVDPPRR